MHPACKISQWKAFLNIRGQEERKESKSSLICLHSLRQIRLWSQPSCHVLSPQPAALLLCSSNFCFPRSNDRHLSLLYTSGFSFNSFNHIQLLIYIQFPYNEILRIISTFFPKPIYQFSIYIYIEREYLQYSINVNIETKIFVFFQQLHSTYITMLPR